MATCLHCGEKLEFWQGIGWRHPEGGVYMMRCDACGSKAALLPSPIKCPRCGSERGWKDDHCAFAVMEKSPA